MTTMKFLSAGLIGIAMLTTSAMAREHLTAERHAVRKENAQHHVGRWIYSHPRIPAASDSSPRNEPGGVCDQGDNAMIC